MNPKHPRTGSDLELVTQGPFSLWRSVDGSGLAITVAPGVQDPESDHIFAMAAAGPISPFVSPISGIEMQRVVVAFDESDLLRGLVDEDDDEDTVTLDVDIEGRLIWFDAGEVEAITDELSEAGESAGADAASPNPNLSALIDEISEHLVRSSDGLPLRTTLAEYLMKHPFAQSRFIGRLITRSDNTAN